MSESTRTVSPSLFERRVVDESGQVLPVPDGWELLPPGDGPLTRKVKAKGPSWTVMVKRGRKRFSQGVWAPSENINQAKNEIASLRNAPGYEQKREKALQKRQEVQQEYVKEFTQEVLTYLNFAPRHHTIAKILAQNVSRHATPVGSGTVARTRRISVEERAGHAVIAWLRHHATRYDQMHIARIKGERRRIRRQLAEQSVELLKPYRLGADIPENCPLQKALQKVEHEISPNNLGGHGIHPL